MIKSITPLVTTTILLSGSFIILSIPIWMTYALLASMTTVLTVHLLSKHNEMMSLVWHFCAEFIGFCMLVVLFVGTLTVMNTLLTA